MEYKQPKKETDNYAGVDFGIVKPAIFSVLNNNEDITISGIKLRFKRMKRKAKARSSHSKATSLIAEIADEYNTVIVLEDLKKYQKEYNK